MVKGKAAKAFLMKCSNGSKGTIEIRLAAIAVWHFERALRSYRQAAARFNEAGRLLKKKSKLLAAKAEELTMQANRAESFIRSLTT